MAEGFKPVLVMVQPRPAFIGPDILPGLDEE